MWQKRLIIIALLVFTFSFIQGQALTPKEQSYLDKHAINIGVDSTYAHGDWSSVLEEVKDKKIILLGEYNHGSREVFASRNDLIMSLHKELGFDVILFEAGIGELAEINIQKDTMNAKRLTAGFFTIWTTPEFVQLMAYVKEHNISIGGFDVQRSGATFNALLQREASVRNIDASYYSSIEKRFSEVNSLLANKTTVFDAVNVPITDLIKEYERLKEAFKHLRVNNTSESSLLIEKTIDNRVAYLKYRLAFIKDKDYRKRWKARDLAMANNVEWLISNFYPNKKVLIIGHNFHTARYNEKEEVMGEFLSKKYGSQMYSLAIYGAEGSFHGNYGNLILTKAPETDRLDIKYIIKTMPGKVHFLHLPKRDTKHTHWMFNKIVINDSFIDLSGSNEIILSRHFDGLLLLDKVTPPDID